MQIHKVPTKFKSYLFDMIFIVGAVLSYYAMLDSPKTDHLNIFLNAFCILGFVVFFNFVCSGTADIIKYVIAEKEE